MELRLRLRLAALVAVVGGASFAYSIVETAAQPAIAYFETTTRVWEFAAGAALALVARRRVTARPFVAASRGRLGLTAVAASAFILGPTTQFPGTAALLPSSAPAS